MKPKYEVRRRKGRDRNNSTFRGHVPTTFSINPENETAANKPGKRPWERDFYSAFPNRERQEVK